MCRRRPDDLLPRYSRIDRLHSLRNPIQPRTDQQLQRIQGEGELDVRLLEREREMMMVSVRVIGS